jgi:hypothetical protein
VGLVFLHDLAMLILPLDATYLMTCGIGGLA